MSRKRPERNVGLCGGLSADNYEALRDARLIGDATGLARIAMVRCVLCHFSRGLDVSGKDLTNCTGVDANAYVLLRSMEDQAFIEESRRVPKSSVSNAPAETIYYAAAAPAVGYLASVIPVSDRCVEVHGAS
jgi:hypothetical protein